MSPTDKKIRIAFLIDRIDYQLGGTETQLLLLLRHLDRTRFEPFLCCLQNSPWLDANRALCPTHVVNLDSFFSPRGALNLWRFARWLRRNRIDVLQSHFRDSNIVATLAGRLAGVRCLVATRRNQGYWHNRLELAVVRILNPLTTYFLVNAHAVRRYIETVERVPKRKIETIYNSLELENFEQERDRTRRDVRAALAIPSDAPVVTLVGNLRPVKGLDVFLHAARTALDRHPNTRFLIVGEGPERARLEDLIRQLNLENAVRLLGKRTDIARILQASTVGALSSHSEGLSNAVIEYMASGLPVVCTDVGGNPELVQEGETGYLTPAGDSAAFAEALLKLLDDSVRAQKMGQNALARAREMFDVHRQMAKLQSFYARAGVPERADPLVPS